MKQTRQFSSRWFRMYDEVVDDPKIQTLSDKLTVFWLNCMCLASKHSGFLPPVAQIAWKLRKTEKAIAAMIAELHNRGLLDSDGGSFTPHNWDARQYASDVSTERVRRHRETKKRSTDPANETDETFHDVSLERNETVSETPSEQNRAETETEQRQNCGALNFPSYRIDENFLTLMGEFELAGYPLIEADRTDAYGEWKALPTEDKLCAVLRFREKREGGGFPDPSKIMRPDRWLNRREFHRKFVKSRDPTKSATEEPHIYKPDLDRMMTPAKIAAEKLRRQEADRGTETAS